MAFTLVRNGIEQSLGAWGIDLSSPTLVLRSFSADEFSFEIAVQDGFTPRVFAYLDDITLKQDGVAIFVGLLKRRSVVAGNQERQRYGALNFWDEMEQLVYEQPRNVISEDFSELELVATTQVVLGRNIATGAKIDTDTQITNLVGFAAANGISVGLDLAFSGLTAPWEQTNDVTVASAIRRVAAWQIDLLARARYDVTPPRLRLRRWNGFDVIPLDLTAANLVVGLECERRDDLRPNGVVFNFLTTVTGPDGVSYTVVTTQTGGPYSSGPRVIKATIPIGLGEDIPPNLASNYYAACSVIFLEGKLTLKSEECSTVLKPGDLINFVNGSTEWDSTFGPVKEVTHQLGSGVSVISFGPPSFLSASTFAALNRRLKDSRPPIPPPPGDPGNDGGGNSDTGIGNTGGPGGSTGVTITHCEGGEQVTDFVKKA